MSLTPCTPAPFRRSPVVRGLRFGLVLALFVPLAACATKRDIRDLGDDLRAQNREQATRMAEIRAEQERLGELIRGLAASDDERQAELLRRFRTLEDEVVVLRELTGASQSQLAAVRDQLSRNPSSTTTGGGRFVEGEPGDAGEIDAYYEEALTAHGRGSLAAARIGFQEIVDRYPGHVLVPDARYYLADITAREGDLDEALRRFLQVAELHPTAERVPEALYRAGIIHRDRGEADRARELFTRIVNTWPDHEVAELARAFLGGA
jgi:TolA-binding protein